MIFIKLIAAYNSESKNMFSLPSVYLAIEESPLKDLK